MDGKLVTFAVVVGAIATNARPAARPQLVEMPWLHGLSDVTITNTPVAIPVVIANEDEILVCAAAAYHRFQLVADVAPAAGKEVVTATFVDGISVTDREHRPVAVTPGYACEGSADEIVALAAGRAFLDPTIVLALTRGGHQEQTTDLALFRVGFGGRLDPVFTAEVERRHGDRVQEGDVWLLPGALLYRRPGGQTSLWTFDSVGRAYVHGATFGAVDDRPHDEPSPFTNATTPVP